MMLQMAVSSSAQSVMLGSNMKNIYSRLNEDPVLRLLKIDTLETGNIALKCKSSLQYPYFIYEFSQYDECVSYTMVSNDRQVFSAYMDFLNLAGRLEKFQVDRRVFQINTMAGDTLIYIVSEPFLDSELMSKRSVFSVQIEKKQ